MPFTRRVWRAGRLLLLAAAMLATYVVFAAVGMRVALRAREVRVPDLVGRPVDQASRMVADFGLTLTIDPNRRTDARIPADRIIRQDPEPGAEARRQRSIRVWLSTGPSVTIVPDLVGQTERTARIRLDQGGLETGPLSEFRSPEYPSDAVVAQDPAPSSRAPRVSLLLNRGEQATTYVMPDLIGIDGARAAEALRSRGFRVAIVGSQPYPGVPSGIVVRQQPPGGFQVSGTDPISLEVSR